MANNSFKKFTITNHRHPRSRSRRQPIINNLSKIRQFYAQKFYLRAFKFKTIRHYISVLLVTLSLFFGICSIVSYDRAYALKIVYVVEKKVKCTEIHCLKGRCRIFSSKGYPYGFYMKNNDYFGYHFDSEKIKNFDSLNPNVKYWRFSISEDSHWIACTLNILAGVFFATFLFLQKSNFKRLDARWMPGHQMKQQSYANP